jgi:glucosamine--fructose-6-phosphate aminotransferase (isomerizing)
MNKFLKEIFEQPQALEKTLKYFLHDEGKTRIEEVASIWRHGKFNDILFTGMGSSFFAPYTATCLLSNYGIISNNINAGELLHYHLQRIKKNSLLVCVSQSGESYEVVKVLEKIPEIITCIGITNEEKSTLAKKSHVALLSKAGHEEMTSSKTYISTLFVLSVFSKAIAGDWTQASVAGMNVVIDAVSHVIDRREQWLSSVMDFLGQPHFVQIIGRGPSYSSVLQGSLMVMEAARNPAAGMLGGEFRHGPLEMAKKGFRAVILAPLGDTYDQSVKLADDITKFGGRVVFITNGHDEIKNKEIFKINIPCPDEYLFPIASIIPLQFIVNQWAVDAGHEPGNFIMGAKVTTTE